MNYTANTSAERAYRHSGFGGCYELGDQPAVVVVDLTLGFTDPKSPLGSCLDSVVQNTRLLVDVARENGHHVLFTSLEFEADLSNLGIWAQKVPSLTRLTAGSRWVEIDPRLGRRDTEPLLVKQHASAFAQTSLRDALRERSADTLIVTGAATSGCVRATVVDAVTAGLPVIVPQECVGDRAPDPHAASILDMAAKYADVMSLDSVSTYLVETRAK